MPASDWVEGGLRSFWTVSVPAAIFAYHQTTGEWPSFDNPESTAKVRSHRPLRTGSHPSDHFDLQVSVCSRAIFTASWIGERGRGQVSAVVFGFLNVARALVPVRIAITLATVPLGLSPFHPRSPLPAVPQPQLPPS